MKKILILLSFIFVSSQAIITTYTARTTQFKELTEGQCYYRTDCHESTEYYIADSSQQFKCKKYIEPAISNGRFKFQQCLGSETEAGSITFVDKYYDMSTDLCVNLNQNFDACGNEIIYVDGFPMGKTDIENASYFDDYNNELICNSHYLQINNSMCLMPSYDKRNLADVILKRDKIARENNLTNVSDISAENITYNSTTGAIESFSFTAQNSSGAIESIFTSFEDDTTVYTVEEDRTITETEYVPTTNDNTTGTDTNTGSSDTTLNTSGLATSDDIIHVENKINFSNQLLDEINTKLLNFKDTQELTDILSPVSNSQFENDSSKNKINNLTTESESVIDEAKQAIQNIQDGYTNIKNNIDELNNFLDEKTNNQAQLTIKNNLELEKKEINMFGNKVSMNCFFNQDLYHLFDGIRPLITFLLNIVFAVITIKMWLKAFRFATGNL